MFRHVTVEGVLRGLDLQSFSVYRNKSAVDVNLPAAAGDDGCEFVFISFNSWKSQFLSLSYLNRTFQQCGAAANERCPCRLARRLIKAPLSALTPARRQTWAAEATDAPEIHLLVLGFVFFLRAALRKL